MKVDLSCVSHWQIGGVADDLVEVRSDEELRAAFARYPEALLIGRTTNLLFDSAGFRGTLVKCGGSLTDWRFDGTTAYVGAGADVGSFVRDAARRGLGGIAHAAGIPGTLGGLVFMNGGSQRKGIGSHVRAVTLINPSGEIEHRGSETLGFAYRKSSLQDERAPIAEIQLALDPIGKAESVEEISAVIESRRRRFPTDYPNCGSVFVSDPALYDRLGPPGKAIEASGLKGLSRGNAQISGQHANFILNRGGASSDDVLWLIAFSRYCVWEQTGIAMQAEVRFVAEDGRITPAHVAAEERFPEWRTGVTHVS